MNTELVREGYTFTTTEWLRVNVDAPEVVAGIHARYATAGAELHIANSFSAARHVLEAAGLGDRFESINRASVELCREAIDAAAPHRQWIAGSVSTYARDTTAGTFRICTRSSATVRTRRACSPPRVRT